jgi:hypothetical protein
MTALSDMMDVGTAHGQLFICGLLQVSNHLLFENDDGCPVYCMSDPLFADLFISIQVRMEGHQQDSG